MSVEIKKHTGKISRTIAAASLAAGLAGGQDARAGKDEKAIGYLDQASICSLYNSPNGVNILLGEQESREDPTLNAILVRLTQRLDSGEVLEPIPKETDLNDQQVAEMINFLNINFSSWCVIEIIPAQDLEFRRRLFYLVNKTGETAMYGFDRTAEEPVYQRIGLKEEEIEDFLGIRKMLIITQNLNLRPAPSTNGTPIGYVESGEIVKVAGEIQSGEDYEWLPIIKEDGTFGYIADVDRDGQYGTIQKFLDASALVHFQDVSNINLLNFPQPERELNEPIVISKNEIVFSSPENPIPFGSNITNDSSPILRSLNGGWMESMQKVGINNAFVESGILLTRYIFRDSLGYYIVVGIPEETEEGNYEINTTKKVYFAMEDAWGIKVNGRFFSLTELTGIFEQWLKDLHDGYLQVTYINLGNNLHYRNKELDWPVVQLPNGFTGATSLLIGPQEDSERRWNRLWDFS